MNSGGSFSFGQEHKKNFSQLSGNTQKMAKAEARSYKKEGFQNIPGDPSLQTQVENFYLALDRQGHSLYVAHSESDDTHFQSAKKKAQQACIQEISQQIEMVFLSKIERNIQRSSLPQKAGILKALNTYKQQTLPSTVHQHLEPILILKKEGIDTLTLLVGVKAVMEKVHQQINKDLFEQLHMAYNLKEEEWKNIVK
ncbi:hypothetical protein GCM10023331_21230 [Algivirga pacifica]|uniref:Uncharacterized protein n=1 Tax=Algivirga pacifica TaxID=1162670 RepID=A0ABP9DE57_9BACT